MPMTIAGVTSYDVKECLQIYNQAHSTESHKKFKLQIEHCYFVANYVETEQATWFVFHQQTQHAGASIWLWKLGVPWVLVWKLWVSWVLRIQQTEAHSAGLRVYVTNPGVTGQNIPPAELYPGLKRTRLDYTRVYYGLGQFIPRVILWPGAIQKLGASTNSNKMLYRLSTVACTGLLAQPSWLTLERWSWLTFLYNKLKVLA